MKASIFEGDLPPQIGAALRGAPIVAVDTETSGLDWRSDTLQLCQLFTPGLRPMLLREVGARPAVLASVLEEPAIVKVFHHAPFDLRFLEARWGVQVSSVACTKTASKLLWPALPHREHSLQPALARVLGVAIEKGRVRTSDWGQEVLSDEQIAYAIGDVLHLIKLYEVLTMRLAETDLASLFSAVCAYLPVDAHLDVENVPNPLTY